MPRGRTVNLVAGIMLNRSNVHKVREALIKFIEKHRPKYVEQIDPDDAEDTPLNEMTIDELGDIVDLTIREEDINRNRSITFYMARWHAEIELLFDLLAPYVNEGSKMEVMMQNELKELWVVKAGKREVLQEYNMWIDPKKGIVCPDCGYIFGLGKKRGR
jgi:hypothetical protein